MFSVPKDRERDRMVLDARVPNLAAGGSDPWIQSLGSLEQLQHIYIPSINNLSIFCEDLREFYHSFVINSGDVLDPIRTSRTQLLQYRACSGAACALLGYSCHGRHACCGVLSDIARLCVAELQAAAARLCDTERAAAGLLIDDLLILDFVAKKDPVQPSLGSVVIDETRAGYEAAGIPRHAGKAVHAAPIGECWGGLLDGVEGILKPN